MHWGKVDVDNSILKTLFLGKKKDKWLSLVDAWYCNVNNSHLLLDAAVISVWSIALYIMDRSQTASLTAPCEIRLCWGSWKCFENCKASQEIQIAIIIIDLCFYIQHFDLPVMSLVCRFVREGILFNLLCFLSDLVTSLGVSMLPSHSPLLVKLPCEYDASVSSLNARENTEDWNLTPSYSLGYLLDVLWKF